MVCIALAIFALTLQQSAGPTGSAPVLQVHENGRVRSIDFTDSQAALTLRYEWNAVLAPGDTLLKVVTLVSGRTDVTFRDEFVFLGVNDRRAEVRHTRTGYVRKDPEPTSVDQKTLYIDREPDDGFYFVSSPMGQIGTLVLRRHVTEPGFYTATFTPRTSKVDVPK